VTRVQGFHEKVDHVNKMRGARPLRGRGTNGFRSEGGGWGGGGICEKMNQEIFSHNKRGKKKDNRDSL